MTDSFSPKVLADIKSTEKVKKKSKKTKLKKNEKYISKVVDGVKHMILNPDYMYKHTN